jgi:hypothetical protein
MAAFGVQPKFVGGWMNSFLFQRQQRIKLGDVVVQLDNFEDNQTYF